MSERKPAAPNLPVLYHGPKSTRDVGHRTYFPLEADAAAGPNTTKNFMGWGIYTSTDEPVIRGAYADSGRGHGGSPKFRETMLTQRWNAERAGRALPRVYDFERPIDDEFVNFVSRWWNDIDVQRSMDYLHNAGPDDRQIAMNIQTHVEDLISGRYQQLNQHFGREGGYIEDWRGDLNWAWEWESSDPKVQLMGVRFQQMLKDDGWDFIHHQGGRNTGGRRHDVFVALTPENLDAYELMSKQDFDLLNEGLEHIRALGELDDSALMKRIPEPRSTEELLDRVANVQQRVAEGATTAEARAAGAAEIPMPNRFTDDTAEAMLSVIRDPARRASIPQRHTQYVVTRPGNEDVIKGLAAGKLDNIDLDELRPADLDDIGWKRRREAMSALTENLRGRQLGGTAWMPLPRKVDESYSKNFDDVLRTMFDWAMTKPTNRLSRSPAFRQYYWQRMGELIPYMTPDVRVAALRGAKEAGVERVQLRNIVRKLMGEGDDEATLRALDQLTPTTKLTGLGPAPLDGIDSLQRADEIAKAWAIEQTKELLYDTARKHNFWDQTRHFFPFGEAWWEIMTTWNRLLRENPRLIRRAQQFVEGAREVDPTTAIFEPESKDRRGFFYQDPSTGEEIFNYPGWDLLAKWMFEGSDDATDATVRPVMSGRVSGVNILLGSFMPGVGPLVQVPVAASGAFMNPDQKMIRELILPFGGGEEGTITDMLDSFVLPAWLRKTMVAIGRPNGDSLRLFNNTVIDILRMRVETGEAKFDTYEDAQIAFTQASKDAQKIWAIRAASQFVGPTGASVRFDVRDQDGNVWAFQSLSTEYRKMLEDNNFNHELAIREFVQRFGVDPSIYYTAKSRSVKRRSVTEPGYEWQQRNEDLFEFGNYELSAYYANPDSIRDPFYYPAYLEQLTEKTRTSLTPEQWVQERNDFLGRVAYERMRAALVNPATGKVRTDKGATDYLRNYRLQLAQMYPGFDRVVPGLAEPIPREEIIAELKRWPNEPRLAGTEAGAGVRSYMAARQYAINEAARLGITERGFGSANSTAYLREWLRNVGRQLVQQYPQFGPVWDQVLSREIEEDEVMQLLGVNFEPGEAA